MPTFIKTGFWEKAKKGYTPWLNLDNLIAEQSVPGATGPQGPTGPQGIQGSTGEVGPAGVTGLNWRGTWSAGTAYLANDAVGYNGASYFRLISGTTAGLPNVDTTNWALLASQGAVGPAGAQGPTGAQGTSGTQTLQQTVDLGNTIISNPFEISLNADAIRATLYDPFYTTSLTYEGITLQGPTGSTSLTLNTSITPIGSNTIFLPNADGTLALQKYKSYVAKITHGAGNAAPTAVVIENTIGTVTWQYEEAFNYTLVSAGLFTLGKTVVFATSPVYPLMKVGVGLNNGNPNFVGLTTDNDSFADLMFEIRVYN